MGLFDRGARTENVSEPAKLLISDHQKVERLFEEIRAAETPNQRRSLVTLLETELTRHTSIEEVVLYPFIEDEVAGGQELVDEAEREHGEATELLDKLSHLDPSSPDFSPTLDALEKTVSHHVEEEERELFPKLERGTDEQTLARLRRDLENEKLGLTPEPALPGERRARTEVRGGGRRGGGSTAKADVWVQPHSSGDGRWQVKREGASRASRVFQTQTEAEAFARGLAKREKVELVVAGRDGAIRNRDSYGNDPRNVPG